MKFTSNILPTKSIWIAIVAPQMFSSGCNVTPSVWSTMRALRLSTGSTSIRFGISHSQAIVVLDGGSSADPQSGNSHADPPLGSDVLVGRRDALGRSIHCVHHKYPS